MSAALSDVPKIWERAARDGDGLGLVEGDTLMSWSAIADEVARRANALLAMQLGSQQRLAVLGENSIDTLLTYAAATVAGVGTVSINYHLKAHEVDYLVRDSATSCVWAESRFAGLAAEAAQLAGGIDVLVSSGVGAGDATSWDRLVAEASAVPPPADVSPGHDLTYTSGTTGYPKGVSRATADHLSVGAALIAARAHYATGRGPHLLVGPLYHGGPFASVNLLLNGTQVIVLGGFDAERLLQMVERYRVASSLMVPTHFVRLLGLHPEVRARHDVSSLQIVGQTGSACPVHVKQAMIDWFGPIFRESYGGTESGILSVIESPEWLRHRGSVGRTIQPFSAVVVDDAGREVPTGVEGRLYFRDATGRGISYHNDVAKTLAAHLSPGVFTLGEIGYVDDDGFIYITDRFSDMVVSGGANIYPAECERELSTHPGVADAAVFGVADDEMGERLLGAVVVSDPTVTAAELVAYCRERLAHYKVPRMFYIVEDLPRSEMGKLDKRQLRAMSSTWSST